MKVKALIPHCNGYGDKFEKAEGDVYDMPAEHAGPLIEAGLAIEFDEADESGEAPASDKRRVAKG